MEIRPVLFGVPVRCAVRVINASNVYALYLCVAILCFFWAVYRIIVLIVLGYWDVYGWRACVRCATKGDCLVITQDILAVFCVFGSQRSSFYLYSSRRNTM